MIGGWHWQMPIRENLWPIHSANSPDVTPKMAQPIGLWNWSAKFMYQDWNFLGFNQQPPNPQEGYCNQIQDKIHPPNPRKVHGVITSRSSWWRCKDMLLMVPWAGMAVVSAVTAPVTCINRHARSNIARGYWAIQMFQKFLYEKLRGLFLPWLRKLQNVGKCSMSCRNFVFWCFLYFDIGEPRLHHLSLNVNVSSRYCKVRHADSFRNFRSWLVAQLHQIQCQ